MKGREKRMEKKNNKVTIIIMGIIIVILVVLCILFATDIISFNSSVNANDKITSDSSQSSSNEEVKESKQENNFINENTNSKETYFYNVDELKIKNTGDYKVFENINSNKNEIKQINIGNGNYYVMLYLNGDINIMRYSNDNWNNNLLNIHKAIDIVEFNSPSEQLMYILDIEGNVYSYKFGDIDNNNYNVTKIENIANVKKLFVSHYSKGNAGGATALFAITDNNECIMLNATSI